MHFHVVVLSSGKHEGDVRLFPMMMWLPDQTQRRFKHCHLRVKMAASQFERRQCLLKPGTG